VFEEAEARTIMEQVVSGLLYLHGHGIMHRDLTLANLLLTRDMRVKIADFGLATRLTGRPGERHVTMCGTPNYISPEVATRSSHGLEADVWGLGCLLYTMLAGRPPFDTAGVRSTLTKVVMSDFQLPASISAEAGDLIRRLLRKNPGERLRLRELPGHPWMRGLVGEARESRADSGMFTMTTTAFSTASAPRPGPRPLPAYPVLREQSGEEAPKHAPYQHAPPQLVPYQHAPHHFAPPPARSSPALLHPSSPPVKMVTDPQDLPAPLLPPPATSLHSLYSRQFSLPEPPSQRAPMAPLRPQSVEMRSHYSEPSLHHAPAPQQGGIEAMVPALDSSRLRPTRQKTKNAVANVTASGEVCLEFLKTRRGEERVVEVMRVSGDGQRVVIYTPGASRSEGVVVGDSPPPIPAKGADAFYSYQSLPEKLWKKYQYAERFVSLVRAKTPKLTLYTRLAKCYLMENSARDFEVYFYSGAKVSVAQGARGREVRLIEASGGSHTLAHPAAEEQVPPAARATFHHFSFALGHCTRIEASLAALDTADHPAFPAIIGRRPPGDLATQGNNNSWEKENRAPEVRMRETALSCRASSVGRPAASQRSLPSPGREAQRKVAVPGVGEAVLLPCGNVRIYYTDGSSLIVRSAATSVDYFTPSPGGGGAWSTHSQGAMPEVVRRRMAEVPRVLELLLGQGRGGGAPPRPASVR